VDVVSCGYADDDARHREQKKETAPCVKMSLFNRVLSLLRYCNEKRRATR
jgi:hypothetical protein